MTRIFFVRFLESYFRHRWLYLLPVLITTLAGSFYLLTQEPKYTTSGILYVNNPSLLASLTALPNTNTNWWITPAQATGNEINELLQTNAFVRAITSETDLEVYMSGGPALVDEVLKGVRKSITVFPVGNNELFISASFEDPQAAYQILNSLITSYTNWQINKEVLNSQVAKNFFDDLIQVQAAELNDARRELREFYDAHPEPLRSERPISELLEIERLQNSINMASSRYESALHKAENANLALQQVESDVRQTYLLLDAPFVPDQPDVSRRRMALQLAVFSAAGLLMTVIGVTGSTLLDRSFRFPIDVHHRLHLPVVAVAPEAIKEYEEKGRVLFKRGKSKAGEPGKKPSKRPETAYTKINLAKHEPEERIDLSI
jgi:capsular polysaccharide biosynthesis protein